VKQSYVILTGSKNNAGDFLIKHRAKKLFDEIRPDREIIDFNAWESINEERLEIVNQASALILMGGPALQRNMYPGIYKLPADLDQIKTPIVTMGIGWKSINGSWQDTYQYPLNQTSCKLLERIKSDGLTSSVRDFHTLNVLQAKGYDNFLMTGCPAYYDIAHLKEPFQFPDKIEKIAFSLGVSFINSFSMEKQMKDLILLLKEEFKGKVFEVVFHHGLDQEAFSKAYVGKANHNKRHNQFAAWLKDQNINFVDISGSAEKLIDYYLSVDLHIGYRVHAHIFMNSLKKLSLLISEDGRAKGSKSTIGGMVVDGYSVYHNGFVHKVMARLPVNFDRFITNSHSLEEIRKTIAYEIDTNGQRSKQSHALIQQNFGFMSDFLTKLP
jgi:hypothetical protein